MGKCGGTLPGVPLVEALRVIDKDRLGQITGDSSSTMIPNSSILLLFVLVLLNI